MVDIEKLFIPNGDIQLEAEYFQSESNKNSAVIITHPHPQFGGNMWNNVVSGVFRELIKEDFSSLRFNFRAVGRSSGEHADGEDERSDVKACIDFLIEKKSIEQIVICGYSYGAAVACSTVNYVENVLGYVAIAFPWDFMGAYFKEHAQADKPKLFIQGDRDNVANFSKFEHHYAFYEDPKGKEIISGADHFFRGYEHKVAKLVVEFCKELF